MIVVYLLSMSCIDESHEHVTNRAVFVDHDDDV